MRRGRPRKPAKVTYINAVYQQYKNGARNRGMGFDLTLIEFEKLIFSNCHYCGRKPSMVIKRQKSFELYDLKHNGVDRKYSYLHYCPGNVVPCCTICNFAKGTMTYDDYLVYLDELIQYRTKPD